MQHSTHTSPKALDFLAANVARRARAAEWFTNPELRPVSAEYDRRETTWPGLLALEIALATHGRPPQRFLDVGCGDGTLLSAAAESSPDTELVGIDIDHGAVENTRERLSNRPSANAHVADAADVGAHAGFPYGRPDLVLVHLNLGLWPDPLAGLCAIAESLGPGGTCYVVDLARPESEDRDRLLDTVSGAERNYLSDQLAASFDLGEARTLVEEVTRRVPGTHGSALLGGLGGHAFGTSEANDLWTRSPQLRELLRQPQADSSVKAEHVLHLYLHAEQTHHEPSGVCGVNERECG